MNHSDSPSIKMFHVTSYVDDFQTFNNPGSLQPVWVPRQITLTFHFDTSLILDDVKLAVLSNSSFE